uniref:Peptidase S1 domain-containing protein n=1 Tax=Trichogramma kaykai TaxID=54128 RepID=A0ABD2W9V9_9HYME
MPFSNFYSKESSGKAVVSGFGSNQVNWIKNLDGSFREESESDGKLRSAEARLMSNSVCVKMYAKRRKRPSIASSHVCAQVMQRDARHPGGVCTGDSGSPLVVHDASDGPTVVGILNVSPPGCKENKYPSIYARVSAYGDFVRNAVRGRLTPDMRLSTRERRY